MAHPQFKKDDTLMQTSVNENTPLDGVGFDDVPRRLPKSVKWLAGTAVGLVILAGAAGLVATQVIDQQKYKELIVSKVEESTGYTIDWKGNINLGLMPLPHASVSELTVKSGDSEILSIAKADVQVALSPLLSKKIQIKNISIDEPVVRLTTSKNGQQEWIVTKKESADSSSSSSGSDAGASSSMDITVDRIEITNGKFISDNQQTGSKQEFDNLNVNLSAESLSGPFDLKGNTVWSGQRIEVAATSGEINADEGSYPIQADVTMADSGVKLGFSGVIDTKKSSANGDVDFEVEDIAKASKGLTGSSPALPKGLDGQVLLAGKLIYSSSRVALDEMALSLGALSYSGAMAVDGMGQSSTPQLSFNLTPKAKAPEGAEPLVQVLSDLSIMAKGSVENDKIQIATARFKTQGNDISINGYATTGAKPEVNLMVNASEVNLDSLQQKLSGDKGEGGDVSLPSSAKADDGNMGFSLPFSGKVKADVGRLVTGGKTYSNIHADISSQAGGLNIASASLQLPEDTAVDVSGKIGNTQALSDLDLKVAVKTSDADKVLQSYAVALPEKTQKIGAAALNGHFTGNLNNLGFTATVSAMQFSVSGAGSVADPMGTPVINSLKFSVKHPNFNQAMKTFQPDFDGSSGFSGALDLSGDVAWGDNQYKVTGLSGKLGQTTIAGNVSAATQPKMAISGNLDFGTIILPSANNNGGTVENSSGEVSAPSRSGNRDRWSREAIDMSWMHSFDADLNIKAKSITQNMWKLTDANFAFNLKDGTLTLDDVSAGLFGGNAAISGVIKSGSGKNDPMTVQTKLTASNVDAQGLMSAATGKVSHVLSGTLSDVNVSINATGASPAALIQTLSGAGAMNGKNIVVTGVDVVALSNAAGGSFKPLERAGALSKSMGSDNQTKFDTFDSEFGIENGIVDLKKCQFDSADASMGTTGTVNLPQWSVNLSNRLVLKSNEAEPITFTINGSLDNPAQSGLQNYLLNRATKLLLKDNTKLGKTLGKFLGGGSVNDVVPASPDVAPTDAAPAIEPVTPTGEAAPAAAPAAEAPKLSPKQQAQQEAVKALQGLFAK